MVCTHSYVNVFVCSDVPPPSSLPLTTPTSFPLTTPTHETIPMIAPPAEPLSAGTLAAVIVLVVLVVCMLGVLASILLGCYYTKRHQRKKLIQLHREATSRRSAVCLTKQKYAHSVSGLANFQ